MTLPNFLHILSFFPTMMATSHPHRAGRPQPLFRTDSSAQTHPISFSTSNTMLFRLQTVKTTHRPRVTPSGASAVRRRAVEATRRAGRPQPLFPTSSSAQTQSISFSTSETMLFRLQTVRTAHRLRKTPRARRARHAVRRRAVAATFPRSPAIFFARSEPDDSRVEHGRLGRAAHRRGIGDRRSRGPRPAGRACDVRARHTLSLPRPRHHRRAGRPAARARRPAAPQPPRHRRRPSGDAVRRPLTFVSFSIYS